MRVVIVYESLFGNTREVAGAIRDGIAATRPEASVSCVQATEADRDLALGADLLVVGGPTHLHGLSTAVTRKMGLKAEQRVPAGVPGHGRSPAPPAPASGNGSAACRRPRRAAAARPSTPAAMSGTRAGRAGGIARRLRRHGYELIGEPAGFLVEDVEGPLREGEQDRARAWGASLLAWPVACPR